MLLADDRIYFGKDGNGMAQRKKFWLEHEEGMVPWTWWSFDYAGRIAKQQKKLKIYLTTKALLAPPSQQS